MLKKMRQQQKLLMEARDKEIVQLENIFADERKMLRITNAAELEALHEERRVKEA
jgi:hypothetical protein